MAALQVGIIMGVFAFAGTIIFGLDMSFKLVNLLIVGLVAGLLFGLLSYLSVWFIQGRK